ncbi:MAG TPA: hypothetical protein VET87_02685 [Rubrivivax sp.]|nr:hypothetical protein [Rubrivivax sp.]
MDADTWPVKRLQFAHGPRAMIAASHLEGVDEQRRDLCDAAASQPLPERVAYWHVARRQRLRGCVRRGACTGRDERLRSCAAARVQRDFM